MVVSNNQLTKFPNKWVFPAGSRIPGGRRGREEPQGEENVGVSGTAEGLSCPGRVATGARGALQF